MAASLLHYIFLQHQVQYPRKTSSVHIYGAKTVADDWVFRATPISSLSGCRKQSSLPQDGTALCNCTSNLRCKTNTDDSLLINYKTIWSHLWKVASPARCRRLAQLQVQLPSQHEYETILNVGKLANALQSKTGHLGEQARLVSPCASTKSWHQGTLCTATLFCSSCEAREAPSIQRRKSIDTFT